MADLNFNFSLELFLEECAISSLRAYEKLKDLLNYLENFETRKLARIALHSLYNYVNKLNSSEESVQKYHFSIEKLTLDGDEQSENSLLLLQLPSIFTPEDWSFTFFEGLMRYPRAEFEHRVVAELGCGNGWISIALAKKCFIEQIYGFDINPRSIVCAKINLYLNALNDKGQLKTDFEGKSLLDRIQFHTSDLFEYCILNNIKLDKAIGCIPQVLSPDLNLFQKIITESTSDESLYALSNYCSKQGYIEDQFGLGLIARALEEAIKVLKPDGRIILNLGGRPGTAVLDRLLSRRGFKTSLVWKTMIEQAGDTEILPLVEIENKTSHRFEFFMTPNSTESISARTALMYSGQGGKIYHSLKVVEAHMKEYNKLDKILSLLKKEQFESAKSSLDLTYDDFSLVLEKISFLAHLSDKLEKLNAFPYDDVSGKTQLRRRIAEYFRAYWRIPITAKNILIAPTRIALFRNIFSLFSIKKALVDKEFSSDFPQEWIQTNVSVNSNSSHTVIIESPKQCDLICKLIEKFQPSIVICSFHKHEIQTKDSFLRLVSLTEKYGIRLIVDFSHSMELSSTPTSNGLFDYLLEEPLPLHVTLICGLIHSRLYSDFQITFIISENISMLDSLANVAELTYSRTPILNQEYYDTILFDLLNFQVRNSTRQKHAKLRISQNENSLFKSKFVNISNNYLSALEHQALKVSQYTIDNEIVRLDYGENSLKAPEALKAAVLESFARQNISSSEANIEKDIVEVLNIKFGIHFASQKHIVVSNGISSIFSGLAEYCALNNDVILFPNGSYGYFVAATKFFGTPTIEVPTCIENHFKITHTSLAQILKNETRRVWLFLNAPIVNPTGAIYSQNELTELFKVASHFNCVVILDTIFSGLEFSVPEKINLDSMLESLDDKSKEKNQQQTVSLVLLGGISKEFSAGGIRIGYAYSTDEHILKILNTYVSNPLSLNTKYIGKKIFALFNSNEHFLYNHLAQQRKTLSERSQILFENLKTHGWEPLKSNGGLFMIASPKYIVGKKILILKDNVETNYILSFENIQEALFYKVKLLINGPQWTGIPEYCRFVLSVTEAEFESALEKIRIFWSETYECDKL